MSTLILSPEDLAKQLEMAVTDVAVVGHEELASTQVAEESILMISDAVMDDSTTLPTVPDLPTESVMELMGVRDRLRGVWEDIREWSKRTFQTAQDRMTALAEKLIDLATRLGSSVEQLIARLYRRVLRWLLENSIAGGLMVGGSSGSQILKPTEATTKTVMKSSPSLASLDVTGVATLLSGLLSMELNVEVKYKAV